MLTLPNDLREFAELLNSHEVRYVVVGGYAVAYHGFPRTTGDIDFFVEVSPENARKLESVLIDFGFGDVGLTATDFLLSGMIFQLGYPPNRIDLLTAISGLEFADAWASRERAEIDGLEIPFIGKAALLANKAATGRPKDLVDIGRLT